MDYLNWAEEYTEIANRCERIINKLKKRKLKTESQAIKQSIDLKIKYYKQIMKESLETAKELRGKNECSKT